MGHALIGTIVVYVGHLPFRGAGVVADIANQIPQSVLSERLTIAETNQGGLNVLHLIQGYGRAIIVDTIQTAGGKVGDVYRLTHRDFPKGLHVLSPHSIDLFRLLNLGDELGLVIPRDTVVIAVEVGDLTMAGRNYTREVEHAIQLATDVVIRELEYVPSTN